MKHHSLFPVLILSVLLSVLMALPAAFSPVQSNDAWGAEKNTEKSTEKTFTKEMRRIIGENQSRDDARAAAFAEAKRLALEEAGTFLLSLTVVKNYQIARDEIIALTSGVT